jgi:hypothetical protein
MSLGAKDQFHEIEEAPDGLADEDSLVLPSNGRSNGSAGSRSGAGIFEPADERQNHVDPSHHNRSHGQELDLLNAANVGAG